MMHKLSESASPDMMFDLSHDPFELNNLLGKNALTASEETIENAKYLRCLLLEWMQRMEGEKGYYSDPFANYGEGLGDIEEVWLRQSWPALDLWTSHSEGLKFGDPVWNGSHYIRNKYLYLGSRTPGGITTSSPIYTSGSDFMLFCLSQAYIQADSMECVRVRVSFVSETLPPKAIDVSIEIAHGIRVRVLPVSFQ